MKIVTVITAVTTAATTTTTTTTVISENNRSGGVNKKLYFTHRNYLSNRFYFDFNMSENGISTNRSSVQKSFLFHGIKFRLEIAIV